MKPDILLLRERHRIHSPLFVRSLKEHFTVHEMPATGDKEAFVAGVAERVRALVTTTVAGADADPAGRALDGVEVRPERLRRVCAPREERGDSPVLAWMERLDLAFPINDEPQRDRLHSPCGEAAAHLAPQHRAESVADDAVQDASGLLCVDQLHIYGARVVEGFLDGRGRDLVEDDPA